MAVAWFYGSLAPHHFWLYHVPLGYFPPDILAEECDLFSLFPLVTRVQSLLASGLTEETDTQESILKKISYALEQNCNLTEAEIRNLYRLVDPDTCPSKFLALLAETTCCPYLGTLSPGKQRIVIKAVVLVWMAKGTKRSWKYLLHLYDLSSHLPWELWKRILHEKFDYVPYPDYYHRLRAARVDLTDPDDPYERLSYSVGAERMKLIEPVRPVHVLLRPTELTAPDAEDTLAPASDVFNFGANFNAEDPAPAVTDELAIDTSCVHWCEASCQSGCEYTACETGCEAGCETGCQVLCELNCQTYGESSCLTSCQLSCEVHGETGL